MEAFAAFSLAAGVVQFISFTAKLISEAKEIHDSLTGTTKKNEDLEETCTQLRELSDALSLKTIAGADKKQINNKRIRAEEQLEDLARKCKVVSEDLHGRLLSARLRSSAAGRVASFRQVIHNVLSKPLIQQLEKRLQSYRDDLMLHLVAITRQATPSLARPDKRLIVATVTSSLAFCVAFAT
jgi:predicted component of type VI protein secretion system